MNDGRVIPGIPSRTKFVTSSLNTNLYQVL